MKKEKSAKRETYGGRGPGSRASGAFKRLRVSDRFPPDRPHRPQPVGEPSDPSGADCLPGNDRRKAGDRFRVEVYPSELLGSQTDMVQLTQTGAMDFCVASNAILETFSKDYELFNLPYLFQSTEAYHGAMEDEAVTGPVFFSHQTGGLYGGGLAGCGTRNFYTVKKPVKRPEDLRGLKIRVQQSPHQY